MIVVVVLVDVVVLEIVVLTVAVVVVVLVDVVIGVVLTNLNRRPVNRNSSTLPPPALITVKMPLQHLSFAAVCINPQFVNVYSPHIIIEFKAGLVLNRGTNETCYIFVLSGK